MTVVLFVSLCMDNITYYIAYIKDRGYNNLENRVTLTFKIRKYQTISYDVLLKCRWLSWAINTLQKLLTDTYYIYTFFLLLQQLDENVSQAHNCMNTETSELCGLFTLGESSIYRNKPHCSLGWFIRVWCGPILCYT